MYIYKYISFGEPASQPQLVSTPTLTHVQELTLTHVQALLAVLLRSYLPCRSY